MSGTAADPAGQLIDHALGLDWQALADSARSSTTMLLHDTLCVGAAGANALHADAILALAHGWGSGAEASLLGRPDLKLPAASAAFVNAFQIHGQEFDCVHEAAVLHPLSTIVAALLAEAQRGAPVSSPDFLAAMVAGVDVAVMLGRAATSPLRFFRPATAGIFGSVAAITRMRRLARPVALDAFGHALALASGTMQAHVEGKPALPIQVANAARNALVAIDLARGNIPGVTAPIAGAFGYLTLFEETSELGPALAELRDQRRIEQVSIKPFPTGRAAHGGIVAIQQLMKQEITANDIAALEYRAPPLIHRLVGRPARDDMNAGYARLCLPWLGALTLTRKTVSLADFDPIHLRDADLADLSRRISVVADGNTDPAAFVPAVLIARLANGSNVEIEVQTLLGSPTHQLDAHQRRAKAIDCLSFARLGHCEATLAQAIDELESSVDVAASIADTGVMA